MVLLGSFLLLSMFFFDINALQPGMHVIVGTSRYLLRLLHKHAFMTNFIKTLILDSVDDMIPGQEDSIDEILQFLPCNIQVGVFSDSVSPELLRMTQKIMNNPVQIFVRRPNQTLKGLSRVLVES
eukprot:TRINITY_DN3956_c0_g1_i22.p1 TRINITY_DN3956_c0_g1~~TRINITY_DN3956_c0_g1_i22.p1  ORF type:complete len:125 (+),score=14.26 TRINITY_DN3956_c0_g1_i22:340-714(+)